MWIFGRQLFYKLLEKESRANIYLRPDIELLYRQMEAESSAGFSARNEHKNGKRNKLVDSKILLEMLRTFDLNARFHVRSFFSDTLMLESKEGDSHANCFFKKLYSMMNAFVTVSVGFREENIEEWNLRGKIVLLF